MPKEVIMKVPSFSADYPKAPIYVADLVRCKNCNSYKNKAYQDGYGYCEGHCSVVRDDDFCSYGELKSESENSNLTFEKRTMRDCYNCKRYETEDECIECHYEPKDEPKLEGIWNAGYKTGYDKGYKDAQKVKDSPSLVKDLVKAFCEDGTWLERQGVHTMTLAEAKQRAVDLIESVAEQSEKE